MHILKNNNDDKIYPLELLEVSFQRYKEGKYRREVNIIEFGNSSNIIEGIQGFTFIQFSNKQLRDDIIKNFPKATAINEKTDKNGRHIPELVGIFDDEENYYMIVYPNHADTDETNAHIGVYKGMIINPLALDNEIGEDKNVKDKVKKILKKD